MIKFNKNLMYISLLIYIILLVWTIIFKWSNVEIAQDSIYTFKSLGLYERYIACKPWFIYLDNIDFLLNILLFLPMGLYFVLLLKRKYFIFIIAFVSTLLFEVSQFFTCIGMFNFYDIFSNMLGCILGYILYLIFNRFVNEKFIDRTNIVIISLFSLPCIYAIFTTIINFHYYL